jgi:hypothetical protein
MVQRPWHLNGPCFGLLWSPIHVHVSIIPQFPSVSLESVLPTYAMHMPITLGHGLFDRPVSSHWLVTFTYHDVELVYPDMAGCAAAA